MARVTLAELPSALSKVYTNYSKKMIEVANESLEEETKKLAKAMSEATTVHRTGDMEEGWTYKMNKKSFINKGIVYNEKRGSIVHFHEFGTSKMDASPYVLNTFELLAPLLIRNLVNKISKI